MSGRRRMMYQNLKPNPEGTIFSKRSKPQGTYSSPDDTAKSMAERLEMNIQGDRVHLRSQRSEMYPVPFVTTQTEAEVERLRECLRRRRAYGDDAWTIKTARRMDLEASLRPRGRPRKTARDQ